jgi:hypothetical protein
MYSGSDRSALAHPMRCAVLATNGYSAGGYGVKSDSLTTGTNPALPTAK